MPHACPHALFVFEVFERNYMYIKDFVDATDPCVRWEAQAANYRIEIRQTWYSNLEEQAACPIGEPRVEVPACTVFLLLALRPEKAS